MRKFVLVAALMFTVSFLGGCATIEGWFGDSRPVVTSSANVADGVEAATVPVASLPESVRKLIPEGMDVVVINREDLVSEDAAHIPLVGEFDDTAIGTAFDAGMHIAKTFFPALAGWEALLALFFRRKRQHYVGAFKSLFPGDKNIDLGGALSSVEAALGMTHSSEGSEEVFEAELEEAA
jgi:hypothetical protein|tara:strand:- start:259 stop:798 length:540 start_codon:yes stop_codon:yes gene_type:complete